MSDADVKLQQETLKHIDRPTPICTTHNQWSTDMDFSMDDISRIHFWYKIVTLTL